MKKFGTLGLLGVFIGLQSVSFRIATAPPEKPDGGAAAAAVRHTREVTPLKDLAAKHAAPGILAKAKAQDGVLVENILKELKTLSHVLRVKIGYFIVFSGTLTGEQAVALLRGIQSDLAEIQGFPSDQNTIKLFLEYIARIPSTQIVHVDHRFMRPNSPFEESLLFKMAKRGKVFAADILRIVGANPYQMYDPGTATENPDQSTIWPRHVAIKGDHTVISTLFKAGFEPGVILKVVLSTANSYEKQLQHFVKLLIKKGANVNLTTKNSVCPPIFKAVWKRSYQVVRLLREAGARMDVKCETFRNLTPLELFNEIRWMYDEEEQKQMKIALTEQI